MSILRGAYRFALACYWFSLLAQGGFALFVFALGWGYLLARPLLPMPWPWIINISWLLFFALQHSGMARAGFKKWFARFLPAHLQRAFYVGLSGLLVLALTLTWQPLPGEPLWEGPYWISAIAMLGAIGMVACSFVFDAGEFFGLTQAATGKADSVQTFRVVGPYRFVRHPLMATLLIFLWCHATMPMTLAVLNAGLTIYILIVLPLEERDLIRTFGEEYARYRKRVPALLPYRRPLKGK